MSTEPDNVNVRVRMLEIAMSDLQGHCKESREKLSTFEARVQSQESYQHVIESILGDIKSSIVEIKTSVQMFADQIIALRLEAGKGKMAQDLTRIVLFGAAAALAGLLIQTLR